MENALVSSFYWDLDRQMEVIESKEPYYNAILDSNIALLNKITCIDDNVDITQRQKAKMISKEIADFTDNLQVVIAILDSQFNQLAFILTPETPLEFDVEGVIRHFFINGLKGETKALFIEDYNTFIPLNQLTKAETVRDVLSGKVHFEDLTSAYEKIKHETVRLMKCSSKTLSKLMDGQDSSLLIKQPIGLVGFLLSSLRIIPHMNSLKLYITG